MGLQDGIRKKSLDRAALLFQGSLGQVIGFSRHIFGTIQAEQLGRKGAIWRLGG